MNTPAKCLEANFEKIISRHGKSLSEGFAPGCRGWRGPWTIRPMIEFLPVMDAGTPMRVTRSDYADPERRWL